MPIDQSYDFFDKLELLAPAQQPSLAMPDSFAPSPPTDAPSLAGVMDNKIITFTDNLEPKFKEAAKYSVQISQAAANKSFNQITQRLEWYGAYSEALRHCGWIGTSNNFVKYKEAKAEVNMELVAIELLKLAMGPTVSRVLGVTIAAIQALKANTELTAKLQKSASQGESGSFNILPCLQQNEDVVMYDQAMTYQRRSNSGGFWFWSWKSTDISLEQVANKWELNFDHYQALEAQIKAKIGKHSSDFFDELDL